MSIVTEYQPGPAAGAHVEKNGDQWTLVLVRDLKHSPEKVWQALTDQAQLKEWAPYETDQNLDKVGTINVKWVGAPQSMEMRVTQAEEPNLLEVGDMRWHLEPAGSGTRLTLWHNIDRRYIAMGAAGWHIAYDILERLLDGNPIPKIVGNDATKFEGWKRLHKEYAQQFGVEMQNW